MNEIPKTIINYAQRMADNDWDMNHCFDSLDVVRNRALRAIAEYKAVKKYELDVIEEKKRIKQWLESVCPSNPAS